MSDAETVVWRKSPLVPTAWATRCPGCGQLYDVDRVDDAVLSEVGNLSASIEAFVADEDLYLVCDECEIGIEVIGVRVIAIEELEA